MSAGPGAGRRGDSEAASTGRLRAAVFAACVFGISQPLFDQIGRNPEFLGNHHLSGPRLWVFALALTVALPAAVFCLDLTLGRIRVPARIGVLRGGLLAAVAALALVALRRWTPELSTWLTIASAALLGLLAVWLHSRRRWLREFGLVLAWLAWLTPLLFLLRPEVRPLLRSQQPSARVLVDIERIPVVLVTWDELPVSTLMTGDGTIDSRWFPGFARLAATSTWYRDTLTPSALTAAAIPAITTSSEPGVRTPAESAARPSVFQLLEHSHAPVAHAAASGFLPRDVPRLGDRGQRPAAWRVLLCDLRLLYLHLSMPASVRAELPSVSTALGDFRAGDQRRVDLLDALAALVPANLGTDRPLFVYLHSSLPHHPWVLLPSGARYRDGGLDVAPGFRGVAGDGAWDRKPWLVAQAFQRHLLQAMFADRLMADLIDRLEEAGLWQRALVIVTADHGASFEPGRPLRIPTPSTVGEVASVPLFVKLPGQSDGRIDDRPASTLDILPTLAELLGAENAWPMDGRSLLGDMDSERTRRVHHPGRQPLEVTDGLLPQVIATARTRRNLFAEHDPYRIGPYSQLIGRAADEFRMLPLETPTDGSVLAERTSYLPPDERLEARLTFDLPALEAPSRPTAYAIAIDGIVRATTAQFPGAGSELSVMLPEAWAERLRGSRSDTARLDLYRLDFEPGDSEPVLRRLPIRAVTFALSADGRVVRDSDGGSWTVEPDAFRGELHVLPLPGELRRVLGWAVGAGGGPPPERLVVLAEGRSIADATPGVPAGDFLDYLRFDRPADQIFYVAIPASEEVRYFVLGSDGRATELFIRSPSL